MSTNRKQAEAIMQVIEDAVQTLVAHRTDGLAISACEVRCAAHAIATASAPAPTRSRVLRELAGCLHGLADRIDDAGSFG